MNDKSLNDLRIINVVVAPTAITTVFKKWNICILLWLSLFVTPPGVYAQSDINFKAITAKEGLPSNTVNTIIKDKYGLLWLGTSNGLSKFDGSNFTVYRHLPDNKRSLPANEVLSLYEDNSGRIWVGTSGGGLCYYDRASDSFVAYRSKAALPNVENITIRAFFQDHEGRLWVGTYGSLIMVDFKTGQIISRTVRDRIASEPGSFAVLSFFEDSRHRMWVGTNKGLYLYNWQSRKFKGIVHNNNDASSISDDAVRVITEDTNGNIWLGTYNGLSKLLSNNRFRNFKKGSDPRHSISSNVIYALSADTYGKLWVGTEEGVDIYDPITDSFQHQTPDPRDIFSIRNKSIRSILIDPAGIYWVGTNTGGVFKYDKGLALFDLKLSNYFDPLGLNSPLVTAFAGYKPGKVFVGTDGGGLSLFDKATRLFKRYPLKSSLHPALKGLTIFRLTFDNSGKLWIGTYNDGIFLMDPATGSYKQFVADGSLTGLTSNNISAISQDGNGKIWIGTIGTGVNIYDPQTGKFQHINKNPNSGTSLVLPLNDFIASIAIGSNGDIWIGSTGTGIAVYHQASGTFSRYTKIANGLADDVIQCLFVAKDGSVWVGTNQGMSSFDKKTKKFYTYSEKQGLANASVKTILEDEQGMLWLSTDRGISSFDRRTKVFRNFTNENGVQQGSFLTASGAKTSTGDLYFGGEEGFNFFNPATLPEPAAPGKVLLTDLKVNNIAISPGEDAPIKEQLDISKEIRLKYGQNFSIGYVALDYTSPQQNEYAYKLDGFDKDWNYVHKVRLANYTNIDPGTYTFQVKSNNNKTANSPVTSIKVIVLPPFWRTAYAYVFYLLTFCSILYLIRQRGINKLKMQFAKEQEVLRFEQMIETERREALKIHELDELKIKFLTNLSHEFRTPISLIAAPVEKLMAKKTNEEISGDLNMINRNIKNLLNLVNQLLDFRKMEQHELKLNLSDGDIVGFINETAESFKDIAAKKNIVLEIKNARSHWLAAFDRDKLERIIFNLLSNAFKFTPASGTVQLETDVKENAIQPYISIIVSDTGVGVAEKDLENIFGRFYQSDQPSVILNQGSGIGLSIIKEFVELHEGSIKAELLPERGMRFVVNLPLKPASTAAIAANNTENTGLTETPAQLNDTAAPEAGDLPRILVVEDNDEFRRYLVDHLKEHFIIIEAANGKEGWQKTLSAHPQLVVSDISMPQMNGIDLSKKIKADKRTRHIPIILLTAINGEDEQLKGLNSGANDYLTKPFNFQILNARISNLLNLNKSLKDTYSRQIHMVGENVEIESGDLKLISAIMAFMEARLNDPDLSVEEMAKHVGMSRGSLYYKLIELTGLTPIEYMRAIKLDKAAALLESSTYNVAQIAYMTGFGTPSYFSRMFKSKFGVLPSEYLNSKRGK